MVDATRFLGAWLRAGEGIGWLAAGTMPNSLYRMPLVYLFLTCVFCYSCSFLFVVFCVFVFFFCFHWSLVDVPLIFFCPADHVPDWQPRVSLGMVEARSVNVKKTTTTTIAYRDIHFRASAGTGPVVLKVILVTGTAFASRVQIRTGQIFNRHVPIKTSKFNRHVPIKILKFTRHVLIKIIFFTKHLPIKEI